jgi:hypothetical protein
MEKELGYGAHALALPTEPFTRLYSDLNLVIEDTYEKKKKEYEEHQRTNNFKCDADSSRNERVPGIGPRDGKHIYMGCSSYAAHIDA